MSFFFSNKPRRRRWQGGDWRYWDEQEIDAWNADHPDRPERQWMRETTPYTEPEGNQVMSTNSWIDDIVDAIKSAIYD